MQAFGEEHHSQGNYFWLFPGDNQGAGFDDKVPGPRHARLSLRDGKPGRGADRQGAIIQGVRREPADHRSHACQHGGQHRDLDLVRREHVPWISFANVPNGTTVETSSNLRFAEFPSDYNELPTVAFVIPNLENDMHTMYGLPKAGVQQKNAAKGGISDDFIITDVFAGAPPSVQ